MPDATFSSPDLTTFCRLASSVFKSSGSDSNRTGRSWPAGSWTWKTRIAGAVGAAVRARCRARSCGGWRPSRWAGARRRCRSRSSTAVPAAGTCAGRPPPAAQPREAVASWDAVGHGRAVVQHVSVARIAEGWRVLVDEPCLGRWRAVDRRG
jgi:hypothetical protein